MTPARRLRYARLRAGLTQRALGERVGMPQSTVARIELGLMDPRVGTLERLLRACGMALEVEPVLGEGVDRSQIAELLKLSPEERLRTFVASANNVEALLASAKRKKEART